MEPGGLERADQKSLLVLTKSGEVALVSQQSFINCENPGHQREYVRIMGQSLECCSDQSRLI